MKTPLLYGIGITFAISAVTLVSFLMGYMSSEKFLTGMIIGLFFWIVILTTGMVLGTRSVRAQRGTGEFTYGQAYLSGLMIAVFAGLSGVLFNFVFFKFIYPDFTEAQIEWTRSLMEKMNAPPDKVEEALEKARAGATLGRQLLNGVISSVVVGAIISLITSAFLKRKATDEPPVVA